MYGFNFSVMGLGASQVDAMRSFFDMNVVPQFYAPPAMVGHVSPGVEGGILDPNSIVPGLGFGAANIPTPPSAQDAFELLQMYNTQQGQQQQYLNGMMNDILAQKEAVFQNYHYEFDEQGNPVMGEDGKPKLIEGAENYMQKFQRQNWEQKIAAEIEKKYQQKYADFEKYAQTIFDDFNKDPNAMFDMNRINRRNEAIESLRQQEQQLAISEKQEYLQAICGHLPSQTPGQTLGQVIDQSFANYHQMCLDGEQAIANSPVGQAFANYFAAIQEFIKNQQEIWANFNMEQFDPNAMKKLAAQMRKKV